MLINDTKGLHLSETTVQLPNNVVLTYILRYIFFENIIIRSDTHKSSQPSKCLVKYYIKKVGFISVTNL